LFQSVNDDAELGIGQNTGKSCNCRRSHVLAAISQTAGQNVVGRQWTKRSGRTGEYARGVGGGRRTLKRRCCAALYAHPPIADQRIPEEPLKAKVFEVVLSDFYKPSLDGELRGSDIQRLDSLLHN